MEGKEVLYKEVFERSGYDTLEDAKRKIQAVSNEYGKYPDWEVGVPEITRDEKGKYKVSIPLTKYAKEKEKGHSI